MACWRTDPTSYASCTSQSDLYVSPRRQGFRWAAARSNCGCVDHPEIMIFKEQQVLPLLVISYRHVCPDDALCPECLKRLAS